MASVLRTYLTEVHHNLRYRPTWLPGTPLRIGDVGVLEGGVFRQITDLTALGISYEVSKDPVPDASLDFSSSGGVSIAIKAKGDLNQRFKALAQADAGALVEFSRAGAVVLQLRGVVADRVLDQAKLSRDLLHSMISNDESKRWLRDWVAVTDVVRAESASIFISSSADSRIELKASGTIAPSNLADASAGYTVASESAVSTKIIAQSGLTPLFRGARVNRKFFWLYDEVLPASAEAPAPEDVFGDAEPGDDSWDSSE